MPQAYTREEIVASPLYKKYAAILPEEKHKLLQDRLVIASANTPLNLEAHDIDSAMTWAYSGQHPDIWRQLNDLWRSGYSYEKWKASTERRDA